MKVLAVGEAFDGADVAAVEACGEHQAGDDALAIEMNGASAACAHGAALLGAVQVEMVAQCVEQCGAWIDVQCHGFAVELEGHVLGGGHRAGRDGGRFGGRGGRCAIEGQDGKAGGGDAEQVTPADGRVCHGRVSGSSVSAISWDRVARSASRPRAGAADLITLASAGRRAGIRRRSNGLGWLGNTLYSFGHGVPVTLCCSRLTGRLARAREASG